MNRRTVTASLIFATPAFLAACSGTTPTQLQTDADLIATGVSVFAPAIIKTSPNQADTVNTAVKTIQDADKALAKETGSSATLDTESLVAAVQVIAPIAIALLPGGSVAALAATAALALLPAVLKAIGVTQPPTARVAARMDEDAARALLRGLK